MVEIPKNRLYSRDHFWVKHEGNTALVGVSDFLQEEMGDVVLLDLPEVDDDVGISSPCGIIESEGSVSDMISPVSGTVTQINTDLESSPELVNEDPYREGWLFRVLMDDVKEVESLMTPEEYRIYLTDLHGEE